MSGEALLAGVLEGDRLNLVAGGSWTAAHAPDLETLIDDVAWKGEGAHSVSIDMKCVTEFDTFGAWLLERLVREEQARGRKAEIVGLPDHDHGLFAEMHQVNRGEAHRRPPEGRVLAAVAAMGESAAGFAEDLLEFAATLGRLGVATVRVVRHPATFRFTSAVYHFDRVCWQAVPIILLITFLIGGIIAQQGIFHFRKFGAEIYVVDLVGILVLREIGVLIVSIMVAGRSGSSYTAELGSMKMREEIDALRTMGFDPIEAVSYTHLTLPTTPYV